MAEELSDKVQTGSIDTNSPSYRFAKYAMVGAGIGGFVLTLGSCAYNMHDGYANQGMNLPGCIAYGTCVSVLINRMTGFLGMAAGASTGAMVYGIRTLAHRNDKLNPKKGIALENKLT